MKIRDKLQKLMSRHDVEVLTSGWLVEQGYSHQLVKDYVKHGWLVPVARGAFVRCHGEFNWVKGLHAIQQQLQLPVHLGGRSALACQGVYHYVRTKFFVLLCGRVKTHMPQWFVDACEGRYPYHAVTYNWLKDWNLGLVDFKKDGLTVKIASVERAMLELLALVPQHYGYDEASYLMESMSAVDVNVPLVQALLESSTHIKANRLFLHLASESERHWLKELDISKIALGSGNRVLPGATRCDPEYKLYIPDTPLNEGWGKQHFVF